MLSRSTAEMTAFSGTLVNSAILRRSPSGSGCSLRHSRMSGWMPIERSSFTECWVGLVLSSPAAAMYGTSVRCMNSALSRAALGADLADGFEERQRFDVADGAADLDQADVESAAPVDAALDLVGDVRDHLHGAAEVVAAALLADHALVDLAGGDELLRGQAGADEALVVAEVQVGFGAVVGDVHLAVLERAHRARIDVDVRVELHHRQRCRALRGWPPARRPRCPCQARKPRRR